MPNSIVPVKKNQTNGTSAENKLTMKGLVYNGPDNIEYKDVTKPRIKKQTDALEKICLKDLGNLINGIQGEYIELLF
ncbi:hypothetical protein [Yeosuana sp. AK3]